MNTPTPRTDAIPWIPNPIFYNSDLDLVKYVRIKEVRQLETELTAVTEQRDQYKVALQSADNHNHEIATKLEIVTEQRDRLAEALIKCREDSVCEQARMEMCRYTKAADESQANIDRADKALQYLNQPTP